MLVRVGEVGVCARTSGHFMTVSKSVCTHTVVQVCSSSLYFVGIRSLFVHDRDKHAYCGTFPSKEETPSTNLSSETREQSATLFRVADICACLLGTTSLCHLRCTCRLPAGEMTRTDG